MTDSEAKTMRETADALREAIAQRAAALQVVEHNTDPRLRALVAAVDRLDEGGSAFWLIVDAQRRAGRPLMVDEILPLLSLH
jgi:hypothetical protein